MHYRQALIEHVTPLLSAAVPEISGRVGPVRSYRRNKSDLPAIEVSVPQSGDERLDDDEVQRTASLLIEIFMAEKSGFEAAANAIAEKVDGVILALNEPWYWLSASSDLQVADDGAPVPTTLALTYTLRSYADRSDPQTVT
ncbi:MAG: hypothetical protein AAFR84_00985 [Pseudomonadota bacterium]